MLVSVFLYYNLYFKLFYMNMVAILCYLWSTNYSCTICFFEHHDMIMYAITNFTGS